MRRNGRILQDGRDDLSGGSTNIPFWPKNRMKWGGGGLSSIKCIGVLSFIHKVSNADFQKEEK